MEFILKKIKPHYFFVSLLALLIISVTLRIYNIEQRVFLGSDSTRDALIAQEALGRHELPLIGSFSSAGPFVFGPLYFWFNMLALIIFPFSFKTPWILMNIVGVLTVFIMLLCGYFVGGKKLGLLAGLFTAFAPQLVSRSTGLSQHSLVGITTALLLLFFILYWKRKSAKYAFAMGLSFGLALSMHYQALNFFIFLPFLFFAPKISFKKKIISCFLYFLGMIIPSLPLLYWDAQQEFANLRNLMDYMLIGQYRIYVANSWKIFLFNFLPDYWSNVVGGNKFMSGILILLTPIVFLWALLKKRISGEILVIGMIFALLLIVIRYYRGERFDGYMIYIAPFIIIICSWLCLKLYSLLTEVANKYLRKSGHILVCLFIFLIVIFDFKNASQFVFTVSNHDRVIREAELTLYKYYPSGNFQVYDYNWMTSDNSYALGGYLKEAKRTDKNGAPIGVIIGQVSHEYTPVLYDKDGLRIVSLEYIPQEKLKQLNWVPVNPSDIYDDLIVRWTKDQKLTSNFSLSEFVLEKLKIR